jgi:TonB family protein
MKPNSKKFLKRPEFPGGKSAFKEYVKKNLVYPEKALEKKVEGVVHLNARIDDNGMVSEVAVEKGIGFGCDEEAQRLIKNVQFGTVKNKGVRVKTRQRFRIEFKLPNTKPNFQFHYKKSTEKSQPDSSVKKENKFTYSINFTNKQQ